MAKPKPTPTGVIDRFKRLTIIALSSDDELVEQLVLKGGNAMALAYNINTRVSADLDYSMPSVFDADSLPAWRERITQRLEQTFRGEGWVPFDVRFEKKPDPVSPDLAGFWGGYELEFKVIDAEQHAQLGGDLDQMRRQSLIAGPGDRRKIEVDISCHEHCEPKRRFEMEGYDVFVYAPILLVCEKFRAICQQMPEYDPIVKRNARRSARPRDFLDIHTLLTHFADIDLNAPPTRDLLVHVFEAKRVPLALLRRIQHTYDQHATAWPAVQATVAPGFNLRDFRFYFDYVASLADRLHPRRDV